MTDFLGAETLEVTRFPSGSYVDGLWVEEDEPESLSIVGSVQPITGREREALPEGIRTRGRFKLYSEAVLQTTGPGTRADRVSYAGKLWEVQAVLDWRAHSTGLPHHKYLLSEPGEDGL